MNDRVHWRHTRVHAIKMYEVLLCCWVVLVSVKLPACVSSRSWDLHLYCSDSWAKPDGHPGALCLGNQKLECNHFLLHYPGKNEFIIFISPFLIKSLMPVSHLEHCQISDSATVRIECMFEQHAVGLWQINFWEMENIYIWLTSSQPEINPLYNLATMSFGCEQGASFVLWEPAYQMPGPCSLFCFSFVIPGSCILDKVHWWRDIIVLLYFVISCILTLLKYMLDEVLSFFFF